MLYLSLYFAEFFTLYYLSRKLIKRLFIGLHRLTHSKKITIWIFSVLFLPGTIIHELSHFLVALVLFVPVGKFEILPEIIDEGIKLGSVSIARTDPIRKFFVGSAPFVIGNLIIFFTLLIAIQQDLLSSIVSYLVIGYIVFQIGNSMFSSKKDLEGAWKALIIFLAVFVAMYLLHVNIDWGFLTSTSFESVVQKACVFLAIPIVIDFFLVVIFSHET